MVLESIALLARVVMRVGLWPGPTGGEGVNVAPSKSTLSGKSGTCSRPLSTATRKTVSEPSKGTTAVRGLP